MYNIYIILYTFYILYAYHAHHQWRKDPMALQHLYADNWPEQLKNSRGFWRPCLDRAQPIFNWNKNIPGTSKSWIILASLSTWMLSLFLWCGLRAQLASHCASPLRNRQPLFETFYQNCFSWSDADSTWDPPGTKFWGSAHSPIAAHEWEVHAFIHTYDSGI